MSTIQNVKITDEMREYASIESKKREKHINHHFDVGHYTSQERNEIGFLGEFACCEYLGIDWKSNIRENYKKADNCDIVFKGIRIDVKTETVPKDYARKILMKTISDDEPYGRRLINKNQYDLLKKYDIVIFSMFARSHRDHWFPLGFLETRQILGSFIPSKNRPDGGTYPFPACPIPTSILRPSKILKMI